MRLRGLFWGDMNFQWKYGFYFVYFILTVLYTAIILLIPTSWKDKTASILIFTDPATLGLFFMGAIVLLEKSQRVLNSIAVSPVKVSQYILSKVLSLGLISTVVAIILGLVAGSENILLVAIGTFLGSALLSLLGLILASKINSLNQFLLVTIPVEIIFLLPPLFDLFGFGKMDLWFHPGTIVLRTISQINENLTLSLLILILWIVFFYFLTYKYVSKMMKSIGGVKL